MGDFFETFEEDARIASRVLGITLTRRGNGSAGEVPLAGFPHHALDSYLPKFLKAGHKVAICEQLEDPRAAKGIVKRDVIEVVTPGVAFSDRVLESKQNNYLAAVALPSALSTGSETIGLSYVDVSTGEFRVAEFPLKQLPAQIASLNPSEILVQKRDAGALKNLVKEHHAGLYTPVEDWVMNFDYAYELITSHFRTKSLKGFGAEEFRIGLVAAGAVMTYLQETQKANLSHIMRVVPVQVSDFIVLDPATKRNLEITSQISEDGKGSLFTVLDKTRTPMGGRLLNKWVANPLNRLASITERLDAVGELVANNPMRDRLFETLTGIGDLERLSAKVCTARATPRDVIALQQSLEAIGPVKEALSNATSSGLRTCADVLDPLPQVTSLIGGAIADDPPPALAGGGVIRKGYNVELDDLRSIAYSGKEWIAGLQQKERETTGISSLRIGFNNVFGYYIEITNANRDRVPASYTRKQTLANAERYVTPELKEYEEKVLHAEERILALESRFFDDLRQEIARSADTIQENAGRIGALDCYSSLARSAVEYRYSRPEVDDSTRLEIAGGRHPVIERFLPPGEIYTPNDIAMDAAGDRTLIITGPNMSGKSSYLRQTGLIVLLAQIGSFVPATKASIGIVDRIFTRVGANDNIAAGESTFLVEMHEAAHIVNTSTSRSLVLLDEVGRGTSTFDGISIAWALTEYLHTRVCARTLFATHYHELNELADLHAGICNCKVDVREYGDKVVFLHKVVPGFADHSYGIQVAQMAGLPAEVTERAKSILQNLEGADLTMAGRESNGSGKSPGRIGRAGVQITLFDSAPDPIVEELRAIDVIRLTPLEALQSLADLRQKAGSNRKPLRDP
jgi:DNA mismatch repair protein MutS